MLTYFLYGLFFISCLVLVIAVLLQPGKTDAGALFTSNISSTAFGPRGTQSVLSKITITVAAIFMLSALLLSLPAISGNVSVLQTTTESTETKPATVDANTANANVAGANAANPNTANQNGSANTDAANTTTNSASGNAAGNSGSNADTKANANK